MEPNESSRVMRILDAFLQEKNIKWLLTIGMLIVVGSSLMMVTSHWEEMAGYMKFAILLGYAYGFVFLGTKAESMLALRKTSAFLMATAVVLIPMTFFAWNWLWLAKGSGDITVLLALLAVNAAMAWWTARQVFDRFFCGRQSTFLVAYLSLCGAVVIAPTIAPAGLLGHGLMALLWLLAAAGVVKAARRLFWLSEENRRMRVVGFAPALILSTQFICIYATYFLQHAQFEWLGLACVLAVLPSMLSADALLHVMQQRSGNLIRPLPASIVMPLVIGLLSALAGVGVSLISLGSPPPLAVTPTAMLAAIVFAIAATRFRRPEIAWGAILLATLAYNFSPAFFLETARMVVDSAARAVEQPKLPFAFYGLTYLPLLALMTVSTRFLNSETMKLWRTPVAQFSGFGSCLLLLLSLTHASATAIVAAPLGLLLVIQAVIFRERLLIVCSAIAAVIFCWGLPTSTLLVGQLADIDTARTISMLSGAALLTLAGTLFDGRIFRIPSVSKTTTGRSNRLAIEEGTLRFVGGLLALAAAVHWLAQFGAMSAFGGGLSALAISFVLLAHCLIWVRPALGGVAMTLITIMGYLWADSVFAPSQLLSFAFVQVALHCAATYVLNQRPNSRWSVAFQAPNEWLSQLGVALLLLVSLPIMTATTLSAVMASTVQLDWEYLVLAVCLYHAAWSKSQPFWAAGGAIVVTMLAAQIGGQFGQGLEQSLAMGCFGASLAASLLTAATLLPSSRSGQPRFLAPLLEPTPSDLDSVEEVYLSEAIVRDEAGNSVLLLQESKPSETAKICQPETTEFNPKTTAIDSSIFWISDTVIRSMVRPTFIAACLTLVAVAAISTVVFPSWLQLAGLLAICVLGASCLWRRSADEISFVAMLATWNGLAFLIQWLQVGDVRWVAEFLDVESLRGLPVWSLAAASCLFAWTYFVRGSSELQRSIRTGQLIMLGTATTLGLLTILYRALLGGSELGFAEGCCVAAIFTWLAAAQMTIAVRKQLEFHAWAGLGLAALGATFVIVTTGLTAGLSWGLPAALLTGLGCFLAAKAVQHRANLAVLCRPFERTAMVSPLIATAFAIAHHNLANPVWLGVNSLQLLAGAAFYFWLAIERNDRRLTFFAGGILNIAMFLLWRELRITDPQFYLAPIGISILVLVELLREEIPERFRNPLRYAGALTILVSPTFHILGGHWLHLFSLMAVSVLVALAGIAVRVRALLYTGVAFLMADLTAIVVRGCIDQSGLLWLAGIALGAIVLALGAIAENKRETLLQQLRAVSNELQSWR